MGLKFPEVNRCCCCCNLRTGSLIIAVLSIIGCLSAVYQGIKAISGFAHLDCSSIESEFTSSFPPEQKYRIQEIIRERCPEMLRIGYAAAIFDFIWALIYIVPVALLIIGIVKERPRLMLPYVYCTLFAISIYVIVYIWASQYSVGLLLQVIQEEGQAKDIATSVTIIFLIIFGIIYVSLSFYYVVVVNSLRMKMLRGDGNMAKSGPIAFEKV